MFRNQLWAHCICVHNHILKFILSSKNLILKNFLLLLLLRLCPFSFLIKMEIKAEKKKLRTEKYKRMEFLFVSLKRFNGHRRVCMCWVLCAVQWAYVRTGKHIANLCSFYGFFCVLFSFLYFLLVIGIVFSTISKLNRQPLNRMKKNSHVYASTITGWFQQKQNSIFNIHTWDAVERKLNP